MKNSSATNLQLQTYRAFLNDIRLGKFCGCISLSERDLAEKYSVSRTTVRKVLAKLCEDGAIAMEKGWRNRITVKKADRFRFLWLSAFDKESAPLTHQRTYNLLVKKAEADNASLSYRHVQGDTGDNWLCEHLHEYDGIILADVNSERLMPELAAKLRAHPNTVSPQKRKGNLAAVVCATDDYMVGYTAAEYLHKKGFSHMGVLAVSPGLRDVYFHDRVKGFCDFCMEHADTLQDYRLIFSSSHNDFANPELIIQKLQPARMRIDALFVISDNLALRVIDALKKYDIHVPRDISIIGCDDLPESSTAPVPLTTISLLLEDIVNYLWQKLVQNSGRAVKQPPEEKLVIPVIIERSSVCSSL